MTQFDFDFGEPEAPYQRHSSTSREAAEAIEPDLGALRRQVLAYIRGCGEEGATDDEAQVALGMNPSTQRPRRIELWAAGWVRRTEKRRPTRSGRLASVWVYEERKA